MVTAKQKTVNKLKKNLRDTFKTNTLSNPDSLSLDKRGSYSGVDSRNIRHAVQLTHSKLNIIIWRLAHRFLEEMKTDIKYFMSG